MPVKSDAGPGWLCSHPKAFVWTSRNVCFAFCSNALLEVLLLAPWCWRLEEPYGACATDDMLHNYVFLLPSLLRLQSLRSVVGLGISVPCMGARQTLPFLFRHRGLLFVRQ